MKLLSKLNFRMEAAEIIGQKMTLHGQTASVPDAMRTN